MTQILSCITRDYVLQVSDRRLVHEKDGTLAIYEDCESKADDQTKAIVINRTMIFAYMGWAKIEGQNTNEWFATVIKPFVDADQLHKGIFEVAHRATTFFKSQRYPQEKKYHAFIGVGWKRRRRDGRIIPAAVQITNAYDNQAQLLPRARCDFVVQEFALRHLRGGIKILEAGGYVNKARRLTLAQYLKWSYDLRAPLHALHSAKVLAKEIRNLSDKLRGEDQRSVSPVGKNLLVICLPKVAALSSLVPVLGPPDGRSFSTLYVLAEGTEQIQKSATIVQKGLPLGITDITLEIPLPADGSDPYADWR